MVVACYVALEWLSLRCRSAPARIPVDFRIDPDQCVACMACVRVCPADAVAVQGPEVRIVDEACTRCGLCLPACPHDAIVATGDVARALELAIGGRAALILSVESAAYFYPATPEQVVNACYAAGFRTVHRGVLGDELVAREYLDLWNEDGWGTMIRSTCPVIVQTVRAQYPELIPYLAPVATPIAAEARYLKRMYGAGTQVAYAGVSCSGAARSWGRPSPRARSSRWWTMPSRRACRWGSRSRCWSPGADRVPSRWRAFWSRSASRPTGGRGTAARAVMGRVKRLRRRRRWSAPRSSRVRRTSTRRRRRRSFRRPKTA